MPRSAAVLDVPARPEPAEGSAPDVGALLAGMTAAAPATKKGKSTVPVIAGFEELSDRLSDAVKKMKQAETEKAMAEGELMPHVQGEYEKRAHRGDFSKSLNVAGKQTAGVRMSWKDQFSAIPLTAKPALVEAAGERYGMIFDEVRSLALKKTDDASIMVLLKALGQEMFQEFFEVQVEIKPKPGFDRTQFDLPETARQTVRQYKAAVTAL